MPATSPASSLISQPTTGAIGSVGWPDEGDGGDPFPGRVPEADYVAFVRENMEQTLMVPFPTAIEITGITPISGLRPTRYRAVDWPDQAARSRLSESAVAIEPIDRS